ncbi:MAG TPA: tRNA uracil 4-sulfurtransferase ThiI [Candidatus Bipolaricaulota bacterium]|nr:tRNA uracil 4-sulfurtransferase ThiI [Candidatus Bipolaricaulota bacterium]
MIPVIILHLGEIMLKGQNKPFFSKILIKNIKNFLDLKEYTDIDRKEGKIVIELKKDDPKTNLPNLLAKIPGVANAAYGYKCGRTLAELKNSALKISRTKKVETFKIQTSRSDKTFKYDSMEINCLLGEHLINNSKMKVVMKNPELVVSIEIPPRIAYVMGEKIRGADGLPTGSSGKAVCLLSGGIDSPVAAYLLARRGAQIILVHAENKTLSTDQNRDKLEKLAAKLSNYQKPIKLYMVPFEQIQKQIIAHTESSYRMIIYKRFMLRLAEKIARKEKAKAIATGDNLAQVASQTMENLIVTEKAINFLLLRPLIGFNKQEIVDLAEKIGTYEISIIPASDCCSFMVAKHPQTRGKLSEAEKFEKEMDVETLVAEAVLKAKIKIFE